MQIGGLCELKVLSWHKLSFKLNFLQQRKDQTHEKCNSQKVANSIIGLKYIIYMHKCILVNKNKELQKYIYNHRKVVP